MPSASGRVRLLKFSALTSALALAAFATATPAGFPGLSDLGTSDIRPLIAFASHKPQSLTELAAIQAKSTATPPSRDYTVVAELPAAGAVAPGKADLTARLLPGDLTAQRFIVRLAPPPAARSVYTAFTRPILDDQRAIALARLPLSQPSRVLAGDVDEFAARNPAVLAYAPATADITAPFDIVMSGARVVEDDGLPRPHPRPDPKTVLSWLDGRALGQFAPGQHDWVQNPLPPVVFQAKEQKCLAEGIYFEARGESEEGQAAVAQVILNRVRNPAYPDTICSVVYQDKRHRNRCQFSFACDGRSEVIAERLQWDIARRIASDVTAGRIWIPEVGDSTHYHARYVRPGWGRRMIKVDRIGAHIFYRTKLGGWS